MQYLATFTIALLTSVLYFTIFWIVATRIKKLWLADIAWSSGFFIVYLVVYIINKSGGIVQNLILIMLFFWGLRLTSYLTIRNYNKEDFRYENLKNKYGSQWLKKSYLRIFLLQAFVLILVNSASIIATVNVKSNSITPINYLAATIWILGFLIESIADLQLYKFKSHSINQGKVMNRGLWKYSRHPNYLGEILMWTGIFILILPLQYGLIGVISPVMITVFLLKISGINLLEKKLKQKPEFETYKSETPALIPNPKTVIKDLIR